MKYIRISSLVAAILSLLLLLALLTGCESFRSVTGIGKTKSDQTSAAGVVLYINGRENGTAARTDDGVSFPSVTPPSGYRLDGWYSDEACTVAYDGESTAYARYLPVSYTLTLEQTEGTDLEKTVLYTVESPDFTLPTPTRPGYIFRGWTVDGGTERYSSVTIPQGSTGDHLLSAVWELAVYRITYDPSGGTLSGQNPTTYTILSDSFTIGEPSRLGYFFLGWEVDGTLRESPCTVQQGTCGDLAFRAVWSKTVYKLSVASDLPDATVTTSLGEDVLNIGTPVRVTAPLLQGNSRFAGWERNGSISSTSPVYEFLMPSESVTLRATYRELQTQTYDLSSGTDLLFTLPDGSVPTRISGESLRLGIDTEERSNGLLVSAAFLSKLEPGLHLFYLASGSANGYIYLNVTGSAPATAPAVRPTDSKAALYFEKTLTYGGKTYPWAASTFEDFCTLVEYFTLVDGVLQYRADPHTTVFPYTFLVYGDLCGVVSDSAGRARLLDAAIKRVSFPMSPSFRSSWKNCGSDAIEFTLTITYSNGMNANKSNQVLSSFADTQGYLSKTGRAAGFDSFRIDSLPDTITVRTLYELERLPYGYRPVFAGTADDAEEVYLAAREILRGIIDDQMDDYAKVVAIYAWLGENVSYDHLATVVSGGCRAFTVYGALIDRLAVCDGFASAFRLLCQIEGIRAEEYTGVNQEGVKETGHAWNKVWVGGAVFGIDTTWARPNSSADFVIPQYLFLDEAGLLATEHFENAWEDIGYTQVCATLGFDFLTSVETSPGYDLVVSSKAELDAAISYLKNTGKKFLLFRLENGLTGNDLESAIGRAHLSCSYGTLGENDYGYIKR